MLAGGYSKFLEQRALREAQERATAEAQQAEIARLETFVTRFGAKCGHITPEHASTKVRARCLHRQTLHGSRLHPFDLRLGPCLPLAGANQAGPCRASKATQAQSRAKQLEKLKEAAIPLPAASSGAGPGDAKKVMLRLPKAPACDEVVLQLEVGPHFYCNWPDCSVTAETAAGMSAPFTEVRP